MNCPYCGHSSRVVDSRPTAEGIRRRRECLTCGRRFTTGERVVPADIRVLKAHDRPAEEFSFAKLVTSLARVAKGCPLSPEDLEEIAQGIEAELVDKGRSSVHSIEIASLVLARLEELSTVAHRRFAANYMDADGRVRTEVPAKDRPQDRQFGLFD